MYAVRISRDQRALDLTIATVDDIVEVIRHAHVECLTSADGQIDFWFTPSVHLSVQPNRLATELLLAVSDFTTAEVPVLYGDVVLASHDQGGRLSGITDEQMRQLARNELKPRARWVLGRRWARILKEQRRRARAECAAALAGSQWWIARKG